MKCLIADDADGARELLRYILEGRGVEVIEARDGQEAIDLAVEHIPSFVILDISMPKIDGYGVVAALRRIQHFYRTPILALTAGLGESAPDDLAKAGFTGWLAKPIRPAVLREALANFNC